MEILSLLNCVSVWIRYYVLSPQPRYFVHPLLYSTRFPSSLSFHRDFSALICVFLLLSRSWFVNHHHHLPLTLSSSWSSLWCPLTNHRHYQFEMHFKLTYFSFFPFISHGLLTHLFSILLWVLPGHPSQNWSLFNSYFFFLSSFIFMVRVFFPSSLKLAEFRNFGLEW